MRKVLLLILVFLSIALAHGTTRDIKAADETNSYSFYMELQFEIYSIDLKMETVYSSNYYFLMKAQTPDVPNFKAVILKPWFHEAMIHESKNVSGTLQV